MIVNFYLPDTDRSSGWSNHTYVLQFVCQGAGGTYREAWEAAKAAKAEPFLGVPEGFLLPEDLVAIEQSAEVPFRTPEVDWDITFRQATKEEREAAE